MTTYRSQLSPSTVWVLAELRSPVLEASDFTVEPSQCPANVHFEKGDGPIATSCSGCT